MCCILTTMLLIGPRAALLIWWLINPVVFQRAFVGMSWLIPMLFALFLPWTMIMYLIVFPGGIIGFDWVWLGLGVLADVAWYAGGGFRRRVPQYEGY